KVSGQYGTGVELCLSWVKANNGFIPPKAVRAGDQTFVARAKHEGQYIPGKLVEGWNEVFVAYGGAEHSKNYYEVLVESSILSHKGYEWRWADGENVPKGAVVGGVNDGQPLYVARSN
ncbi:DUF3421 domain-containing protein, partial [Salmonella enterica subsp. enterica serovar Typhimurium]|nr:DUF3421 domain-containing protein [Salmonella enterica subsp. enterica serovar Typhimurium]